MNSCKLKNTSYLIVSLHLIQTKVIFSKFRNCWGEIEITNFCCTSIYLLDFHKHLLIKSSQSVQWKHQYKLFCSFQFLIQKKVLSYWKRITCSSSTRIIRYSNQEENAKTIFEKHSKKSKNKLEVDPASPVWAGNWRKQQQQQQNEKQSFSLQRSKLHWEVALIFHKCTKWFLLYYELKQLTAH